MPRAAWRTAALLLPGCRMKCRRFEFPDTTRTRFAADRPSRPPPRSYDAHIPEGRSSTRLCQLPGVLHPLSTTHETAHAATAKLLFRWIIIPPYSLSFGDTTAWKKRDPPAMDNERVRVMEPSPLGDSEIEPPASGAQFSRSGED